MVNTPNSAPRIQLIPQEQRSSASIMKGKRQKLLPQPSRVGHATGPSPACGTPVPGRNPALFPLPWWLCDQTGGAMHKSQKRHFQYLWAKAFPEGEKRGTQQLPHVSPVLQSSSSTRSDLTQFPTLHLQKQHSQQYYRAEQRHLIKDILQAMCNGKKVFMIKKYSRNQKTYPFIAPKLHRMFILHKILFYALVSSIFNGYFCLCKVSNFRENWSWKKVLIFSHNILSAALATANSLYSKDTTIVLLMSYRVYWQSALQLHWSQRLQQSVSLITISHSMTASPSAQ